MRYNQRDFLINLILLALGLSFGLVVAEIAVRFIKPPQIALTHIPAIYQSDPELGYYYLPNAVSWYKRNFEIDNLVEINGMGFHDINHDLQNNSPTHRIIAIGDSFTAALEVDQKHTWTQVLQKTLNEQGQDSAVFNLGIDGTGTDTQLAILKKYLPIIKPDMVILAFFRNDIEDIQRKLKFRATDDDYVLAYQTEQQKTELQAYIKAHQLNYLSRALFNNVYLYRLLLFMTNDAIFDQTNYQGLTNIGYPAYEKVTTPVDINVLLQKFVDLSKTYNFRLLIIPIPPKTGAGESLSVLTTHLSDPMLHQLEIIDLFPVMESMFKADYKSQVDLHWQYDDHFNEYGNYIFGQALVGTVNQYLNNSPLDLQVKAAEPGLWTVVQWVDNNNEWHDVSGWQGELDKHDQIRWWIMAKDFGHGPFRWLVLDKNGGQVRATSPSFYLPKANETLKIELTLGTLKN